MRYILDKVHRELSVTKRAMLHRELLEASSIEDEPSWEGPTRRSSSLRGGEGPMYDSDEDHIGDNVKGNRRLSKLGAENYEGLGGDHYSFMLDLADTNDQALPILENSTIIVNDTAIEGTNTDTLIKSGYELDIGAWLLMVLVVGFAVLGIVTYRSAPRKKGRRASYQYKNVLPTMNEEDWGAE
jgi:hypothetical protein